MNKLLPIYILLITNIICNPKYRCILNKLIAHTKLHSLKESGKNNDVDDLTVKSLSAIGNYNQASIVLKIIMHYDRLPPNLKEQLVNCENDLEYLIKKCENFHGKDNCEKLNKFTIAQKCPKNYKRDDHTRCVKDCKYLGERDGIKIKIIDHECGKYSTYLLDQSKKYDTREHCLSDGKKENCVESDTKGIYIEDCGYNYKRVAFMCIPLCYNELDDDSLYNIKTSLRYCLKDYINLGMPFYDL